MNHRAYSALLVLLLCMTYTSSGVSFQSADITLGEKFLWIAIPNYTDGVTTQSYRNGHLTTDLAVKNGRITEDSDYWSSVYNRNINLLFACASKDVYADLDPDGTRSQPENTLSKEGFSSLKSIWWDINLMPHDATGSVIAGNDGLSALVTEKVLPAGKRVIAIGFKGSAENIDVVHDAMGWLTPFYGTKVHFGFKLQLDEFMDSEYTIHCGNGSTLADWIRTEGNKPAHLQDTKFIIYGHSLGGGVAKLYAATLVERGISPKVITFGAPPVGPAEFVDRYKNSMELYEFVHRNDPVAQLIGALTLMASHQNAAFRELVHFPNQYFYQINPNGLYGNNELSFDPYKLIPCMYYHACWLYIQHAAEDRQVGDGNKDALSTAATMDLFDDMMDH